jgi:hypothetical protein
MKTLDHNGTVANNGFWMRNELPCTTDADCPPPCTRERSVNGETCGRHNHCTYALYSSIFSEKFEKLAVEDRVLLCAKRAPSGDFCFPASAEVELTGGVKEMDKLTFGDTVHVGNSKYSDVYYFSHSLEETISKFVSLTTGDTKKPLLLTSGTIHLPYTSIPTDPAHSKVSADSTAHTAKFITPIYFVSYLL